MLEEVAMSTNSRPATSGLSIRGQGVLLVLISAAVFSSVGLFVKGVEADSWTILFWRGLSATAFTLIYVGWRGRLYRSLCRWVNPV